MDYLIISAVAFVVSGVTLFSGFGLGTVLMPTFALFFPLPVAIAATAVVHLANNVFKQRFDELRASCNACHAADAMPFIRVGIPSIKQTPLVNN